jgi:hypothetical protein
MAGFPRRTSHIVDRHRGCRHYRNLDRRPSLRPLPIVRAESQKQKRDIDSKSQQITQLQTKLTKTQAVLDAILPSANTYNILPNQTLILDRHVTVGLVGTPGNESVLLNINGKPQTVAVGQTVSVSPDATTKCQIVVQSFDVFKAVLVASCSGANAQ